MESNESATCEVCRSPLGPEQFEAGRCAMCGAQIGSGTDVFSELPPDLQTPAPDSLADPGDSAHTAHEEESLGADTDFQFLDDGDESVFDEGATPLFDSTEFESAEGGGDDERLTALEEADDGDDAATVMLPDADGDTPGGTEVEISLSGDDDSNTPPLSLHGMPTDRVDRTQLGNDSLTQHEERPPTITPVAPVDSDATPTIALDDKIRDLWQDAEGDLGSPSSTLRVDVSHLEGDSHLSVSQRPIAYPEAAPGDKADYRVQKFVAKGGMGRVYLAMQTSLGRVVALKTLSDELAKKERYRRKFFAEASITGHLDHPNIVPIHDLGTRGDGVPFYSMKFVTGEPWADSINDRDKADNISILMRVADAMAFAHSKKILHRDLKPENVMLGEYGEVLVVDWGLAIHLEKDRNFALGGTPLYMSPEMANHDVPLIDQRSDVYLLGAILFEILEKKAPHASGARTATERLLVAAMNQILPHETSDELIDVALKAMSTNPSDRYSTVLEFQDAIRECQRHTESRDRSQRAAEELREAKETQDNETFARSVFAYRDAIDLWSENHSAREGLVEAQLAYAENALEQQDYSLGLSLLDPDEPKHQEIYRKLAAAQKQEQSRGRLLKIARNTAVATTLAALGLLTTVYFQAASNARKQSALREAAEVETRRAVKAEGEAAAANKTLLTTNEELEEKRQALDEKVDELNRTNTTLEDTVKQLADEKQNVIDERDAKEIERARADTLRKIAVAEEAKASHRAFVSLTALTAADVAVNDSDSALRRLDAVQSDFDDLTDWEAERLRFLTHSDFDRQTVGPRLLAGASAAEGGRQAYLVGLADGARLRTGAYRADKSRVELPDTVPIRFRTPRAVVVNAAGVTVVGGRVESAGSPLIQSYRAGGGSPQLVDSIDGQRAGEQVTAMAFSPDGKELAVARHSAAGPVQVSLYRVDTDGRLTPRKDQEAYAMEGQGAFMDLAYSADGLRLAAAELGGAGAGRSAVSVWSRTTLGGTFGEPQQTEEDCLCVAFSPQDANLLAGGASNGALLFWNLAGADALAGEPLRRLQHTSRITDIDFSSDGKSLVTAASSGIALVWDFDLVTETWNVRDIPPLQHSSSLASARWSPDDRTLITSSTDGQLKAWPLEEYYNVRRWEPGEAACTSAVADSDSKRLVTGDAAGYTRVIALDSQSNASAASDVLAEFYAGHAAATVADAWSLANSEVLTLAFEQDGTASLCRWQQTTGNVTRTKIRQFDASAAYSLSNDGQRLLVATPRGIRLIDTSSGSAVAESEQLASAVAYFADSDLAMVTESRGRVALYRTAGDRLERAAVKTVASGRDLYRLATVNSAGRLTAYAAAKESGQVWQISTSQAGADITATELAQLPAPASQLSASQQGVVAIADGSLLRLAVGSSEWQTLQSRGVAHANLLENDQVVTLTASGEVRVWSGGQWQQSEPVASSRYARLGSSTGQQALLIGKRRAAAVVDRVLAGAPDVVQPICSSRPPVLLSFPIDEDTETALLAISADGYARIWNSAAPDQPQAAQSIGPVGSIVSAAALSPEQTRAAVVLSHRGRYSVWLASRQDGWRSKWQELRLPGGTRLTARTNVALSDAQAVAWDAGQGGLFTWQLNDPAPANHVDVTAEGNGESILPVAVHHNGMVGIAVDATRNRSSLLMVPPDADPFPAEDFSASVSSLTFTASGKRLLAGTAGGKVAVIDATIATVPNENGTTSQQPRGDQLTSFAEHQSAVLSLRFVPNSTALLSSGSRGEAILWPTATPPKPEAFGLTQD